MIGAYKELSKRLDNFIDNHQEYWDDGDPENGPHLASQYNGPEWAERIAIICEDGINYWLFYCEF